MNGWQAFVADSVIRTGAARNLRARSLHQPRRRAVEQKGGDVATREPHAEQGQEGIEQQAVDDRPQQRAEQAGQAVQDSPDGERQNAPAPMSRLSIPCRQKSMRFRTRRSAL